MKPDEPYERRANNPGDLIPQNILGKRIQDAENGNLNEQPHNDAARPADNLVDRFIAEPDADNEPNIRMKGLQPLPSGSVLNP